MLRNLVAAKCVDIFMREPEHLFACPDERTTTGRITFRIFSPVRDIPSSISGASGVIDRKRFGYSY